MRFLLKPARSSKFALASAKNLGKSNLDPISSSNVAARAWGQQCSPNCGCVLRFEVQLSPQTNTTASPTVVDANYHAKRVMTTRDAGASLKPLLTSHASHPSSPILTSCTCSTLHQLAQQVVEHLPGKSLDTLKNETDSGVVGARSSVAFRHTVLKESILPIEKEKEEKKWSTRRQNNINKSNQFSETQKHFHCYDLVEEAVLSLLHERQIAARKESNAECFSPTIGGYFSMYSISNRKRSPFGEFDIDEEEQDNKKISFSSRYSMQSDNAGWLGMSPSSYFLFGEENAAVSTLNYAQQIRNAIAAYIFGNSDEGVRHESIAERQRPTTTYLQLLDMYGNVTSDDEMEDDKLDDWVNYVDQSQNHSTNIG